MKLPCGCSIEPQYLPLNGGDRRVECEHDAYIIHGTIQTKTSFKVWSQKGLQELGRLIIEEESDEGEPE